MARGTCKQHVDPGPAGSDPAQGPQRGPKKTGPPDRRERNVVRIRKRLDRRRRISAAAERASTKAPECPRALPRVGSRSKPAAFRRVGRRCPRRSSHRPPSGRRNVVPCSWPRIHSIRANHSACPRGRKGSPGRLRARRARRARTRQFRRFRKAGRRARRSHAPRHVAPTRRRVPLCHGSPSHGLNPPGSPRREPLLRIGPGRGRRARKPRQRRSGAAGVDSR